MGKRDAITMIARIPADMKAWIEREASRYGSSQSSEIVRCLRAQMERSTMKDHLCAYGNCSRENTRVLVTSADGPRVRFCCEEHAAGWLLSYASTRHPLGSDQERVLHDLHCQIRHRIGDGQ